MKFDLPDGRKIAVWFAYSESANIDGLRARVTQCNVAVIPQGPPPLPAADTWPLLAKVSVTRHHNDFDRKVMARKFALAKALREAGFDKPTRTAVWEQYRKVARISMDRSLIS